MTNNIKIAKYAPLLEFQKGYTPEFVHDAIKKNKLEGLRIFDILNPLESLDFLKEYTFLKKLHIACIKDIDYKFLTDLDQLEDLSIQISLKNSSFIDLSRLTKLETLDLSWRKNITGLEKCEKLKKLSLGEFTEKDLQIFGEFAKLQELVIKTSSIKTLNGLDKLKSLKSILLGNCRSLHSVKYINGLQNLKKLELNTCPKISNFEELIDLPNLQTLKLVDCGKIKSIKFIKNLSSLKHLYLLGNTEIEDGDMKPAQTVKDVIYTHKKHYNVKIENKNHDKLMQQNLDKISEIEKRFK